jgi:hypothetical protein
MKYVTLVENSKGGDVTGGWRKSHNKEFHNLCSLPVLLGLSDRGMQLSWEGREINARLIVGNPEGKRLLVKRRHRWEDNIKVDLKEMGCDIGIGLIWLNIGSSGRFL